MSLIRWNLTDIKSIEKNNLKVFSCFCCGGGSTMGYKLAGYTSLGGNEIDPKMAAIYKSNHNPKIFYQTDIRDLINKEIDKGTLSLMNDIKKQFDPKNILNPNKSI